MDRCIILHGSIKRSWNEVLPHVYVIASTWWNTSMIVQLLRLFQWAPCVLTILQLWLDSSVFFRQGWCFLHLKVWPCGTCWCLCLGIDYQPFINRMVTAATSLYFCFSECTLCLFFFRSCSDTTLKSTTTACPSWNRLLTRLLEASLAQSSMTCLKKLSTCWCIMTGKDTSNIRSPRCMRAHTHTHTQIRTCINLLVQNKEKEKKPKQLTVFCMNTNIQYS